MSARSGAVVLPIMALLAVLTASAAQGATTPTASVSPPSAVAAPRPVPVVRIPFPDDEGTLTPYTFDSGYSLVTLIYDTLMWRDQDGRAQPWLASSVQPSPDGTVITVRLNMSARWQDGPPVTAADVAFTFGYVAAHPNPRFTAEVAQVAKVATPDPATVTISLKRPSPGFPDQTLADLPILPEHLWSRLRPGQVAPDGPAVGSGPYRLTEHVAGNHYRFDATPGYFRGPPTVQTIVMPIISDAEATLKAFEAHTVDMVPVSLPANDRTRLEALGNRVATGPVYLGSVLLLNTRKAPFDRPEVRRAVSQAVDTSRIAQVLGNDVAAGRYYLHPDSPWTPDHAAHGLDPAAAARVLGPLKLPAVDVLAPENDGVKLEAARQVSIALQSAGVGAQVKSVSRAALSKAVGEDGSAPAFTAAIWSAYPPASYDPDFLARVFGSDPSISLFNYAGYHSAAFDAAALRVATAVDPAVRRQAVAQELAVLASEAPMVPLFYPMGAFAYRPAVYEGWVFVKGSGILDKRSFEAHAPPAAVAAPPRAQATAGGVPGLPLLLGAAGLVVIGLLGAVIDTVRRRR